MAPRKSALMGVEEAAKALEIGEATVWRYLARGLLKKYRPTIGRRRTLVDVGELRHLLEHPPTEPVD